MAEKKNVLLDHDYDGIKELDNDLPPWWLYLFYITIAIAVVYMVHYHVIGTGDSSYAEYQKELDPDWVAPAEESGGLFYRSPYYTGKEDMTPRLVKEKLLAEHLAAEKEAKRLAAESGGSGPGVDLLSFEELLSAAMLKAGPEDLEKLKKEFPDIWTLASSEAGESGGVAPPEAVASSEPLIAALTDAPSLEAGKKVYDINCASCHGNAGQGGIGPNMTDKYWIHGGGMNNVVRTINVGVPAKGMISWRGVLKEDEILQVASFMMTLEGTDPPNGKKPQGEIWEAPELQ